MRRAGPLDGGDANFPGRCTSAAPRGMLLPDAPETSGRPRDEAERMRAGIAEQGHVIARFASHNDPAGDITGAPLKISKDPAEVIPQADVIIMPLPSFAYIPVLEDIKAGSVRSQTLSPEEHVARKGASTRRRQVVERTTPWHFVGTPTLWRFFRFGELLRNFGFSGTGARSGTARSVRRAMPAGPGFIEVHARRPQSHSETSERP